MDFLKAYLAEEFPDETIACYSVPGKLGPGRVLVGVKDTVEADVYFALGQRISLFEGLVGRLQPILSRLPKQFEEVALQKKENREAARHRLMSDLEQSAREAERATLDIDEVAADTLELPDLSTPSLTLSKLDLALNHPGILPAGVEWRRLDAGSYAVRLPGMDREIRVTTRSEVFDDHSRAISFSLQAANCSRG